MTTKAAAEQYLREYLAKTNNTPVVFNPHDASPDDLPTIFGFVNGGSPGWWNCMLIAEDGHVLGGHICSDPGYAPGDLGVVAGGLGTSRHEQFRAHYPDGYQMEFVSYEDVKKHAKLKQAFALADALAAAQTQLPVDVSGHSALQPANPTDSTSEVSDATSR